MAIASCESSTRSDEALLEILAARIEAEPAGATSAIALDSLTSFDWDRVYLFLPFTGEDELRERLGKDWASVAQTGISSRDDIVLLVFVSGGQAVRLVKFPRRIGDFSEIEVGNGLAPSEARFRVERHDRRTVLRLASEA